MKINLYRLEKIKEDKKFITYSSFKRKIREEGYICIDSVFDGKLKYDLYIFHKQRESIPWLEEFIDAIDPPKFKIDYGRVYNGILLRRPLQSHQDVYAMTFGHAFHTVQKYCDYNFAMDFAEKEIPKDGVILKSSDFIQSNKIRALLNIKDDFLTSAEGGESYKFVSGKPLGNDDQFFGTRIECGYSIHFVKELIIESREDFNKISKLIKDVETVLRKPNKVNPFPRVSFFSKKNSKNDQLDTQVLNSILKKDDSFDVYTGAFEVIGSKILMLNNSLSYSLHILNGKKETLKKIEFLDKKTIESYFAEHITEIKDLNDVIVTVIEDGNKRPPTSIRRYLFAVVTENKKNYMLTSNRWGVVNQTFTDEVKNSLVTLNEECLKIDKSDFNFEYIDEDDYVKSLVDKKNCVQLHTKDVYITRNLKKKTNKIELADIYDRDKDELYAVKLGKSNQAFIYSFDQANSASKILLNSNEYNLKDQLEGHKIKDKDISDILNCTTYSVLLGFEQDYIHKAISNDAFELNILKSFLLKLKIISSAGYIRSQGLHFNLHVFAGKKKVSPKKVKPIKKKK